MTGTADAGTARTPATRRARWAALPANTRGAALVLLGCLGFSIMGALVKLLGQSLDSFQVAFFRCAVGAAVIIPYALITAGPEALRTRIFGRHLARAVIGMAAMFIGFYAITHLPLATATAISFGKPLFMIVLAVALLHEAVRWRRWTATAVGFVGVLVILRPGAGTLEPAALVAVAQALFVALAVVLVKTMQASERNITVLAYFGVLSTSIAAVPAMLVWQAPSWEQIALGVAIDVLGVGSQACMVIGHRLGEATAVAPFDYSRLLFATVLGFFLFSEVPDFWTWTGAALIVASTLYIARREARLGNREPAAPLPHG